MTPRNRTAAAIALTIALAAWLVLPGVLFLIGAVVAFCTFCGCVAAVMYERAIGSEAECVALRADNESLSRRLAAYKATTVNVRLVGDPSKFVEGMTRAAQNIPQQRKRR